MSYICDSCTVDDYRKMKDGNLPFYESERIGYIVLSTLGILAVIVLFIMVALFLDSKLWSIVLYVVGGILGLYALYHLCDDAKHLIRIRKVMKEKNL
jgi:predicted membrane channel-forming protein YqfA (hemolysin III family)